MNTKTIPFIDETGMKLPKNMSEQFRRVQGGIEYLKQDTEDILVELKTVGKKLYNHTTDLSLITSKVNQIESTQKKHLKQTVDLSKQLQEIKKTTSEIFESFLLILESLQHMQGNTRKSNS
jgi:septal ring factor EnvC (AmiA/AmiB activator)